MIAELCFFHRDGLVAGEHAAQISPPPFSASECGHKALLLFNVSHSTGVNYCWYNHSRLALYLDLATVLLFFSNVARVLSRLLLCSQLIYADRNYDGSKRRENLERSASQNHNIENLVDVSMPQLPNSVSPISFLSFIIQHRCEKKGRNFPLFPVLLVLKYIMMLLS